MLFRLLKKVEFATILALCIIQAPLFSQGTQNTQDEKSGDADNQKQYSKEELNSKDAVRKLSETYGHLIQKSLENPTIKFDYAAVIRGMNDAKDGKKSPLTEKEYEEMLTQMQEYSFQDLASANLKKAEDFLKENATATGVKIVSDGKVQYIVLQEGKGQEVVEGLMPSIKYKGQYIDGTVFGSSEGSEAPVAISLNHTIPGFRQGVMGMKEGEKRRIFIHPEVGYGLSGQLAPNALLIFEVEVVDVKPEPKEDKNAVTMSDDSDELADDDIDDDNDDNDDDDDKDNDV